MTPDAEAVLRVLRERSPRDAPELGVASGVIGQRLERAVEELEAFGLVERSSETGPPTGYSFSDVRLLIDDDE